MPSAPLCLIQSTLKSSLWLSLLLSGTYELAEVESVASIPVQPVNSQPTQVKQLNGAGAVLSEADQLYHQGTAESVRAAIAQYEEAAKLSAAAGDRLQEACTLNKLGTAHLDLGEMQKALFNYNQAFMVWETTGNQAEAAATLNLIGTLYTDIKDRNKALDVLGRALQIYTTIN